jgi:hypothetical protein
MSETLTTNLTETVATFATGMRAASLREELAKAGISSIAVQPKWTNKRLPPPRMEVKVAAIDAARAKEVVTQFNAAR